MATPDGLNVNLLNLRAEAFIKLNKLDKAIADCEQAKQLDENCWSSCYRLGVALFGNA